MQVWNRIAILLLYVTSSLAHSNNAATPASFTEDKKSLQNLIEFPDIDGDVKGTIICEVGLARSGQFLKNFCFSNGQAESHILEQAIHKAAKTSRIKPATVNGKKVNVWFQYSVEFIKQGERKEIHVYPNHGIHAASRGKYYSSAQRYRGARHGAVFRGCPRSATNVWIGAVIDELGIPRDAKYLGGQGNEVCIKNVVKYFTQGRFIPAQYEGETFESSYAEPFWIRNFSI